MRAIRIFLLDDHEIVRRGVAALLDAQDDLEVVGEASTAAQARERIRAVRPDVAVLDVRLPDGNGIDVCRQIRQTDPTVRCLILTAYDDDAALSAAVIAGAAGYVIKDVRAGGLVDAVRAVAAGRQLIDPRVSERMLDRFREAHRDPAFEMLTRREREILALIADGLTNRQIAQRLSLAEKTIKNNVSSVLAKLGLASRTQAAVLHRDRSAHRPPRSP